MIDMMTTHTRQTPRHAFTLVELSIVLVILGLLVGGVVAGQSLIRASEVRRSTVEFDIYRTAISTFRAKYGTLPGDFDKAADIWGTDPTGCPWGTYAAKRKETCNGDGNGKISTFGDYSGTYYEIYRAWQHLANAGYIEGEYVGVSGTGAPAPQTSVIKMNVPPSRVGDAGWTFYPLDTNYVSSPDWTWNNEYQTPLLLSAPFRSDGVITPILSGPESWKIDSKIDDGKPGYGIVSSWKNTGPGLTCLTSDTRDVSEYRRTDETLRCSLIFKYD